MADSIVRLKVEDDSFNAKIKEAAKAFADFGKRVASAGVEAMGDFAKGAATAKQAFEGFNAALKANALVLVASLAVQAASAIGEMIGNWITGADDAAGAQQNLNDKLEETKRLVDDINNEGDFNARLAKAAGASTKDVLQIKADAAEKAMNSALSTLLNPKLKVGTEEYDKAKKIYEAAAKRYQKAIQDQKVDEVARANRTGEYAPHSSGSSRTPKLTPAQQAAADIVKAEKAYADTLSNAQQKLNANMVKDDQYEKSILQGEQKLADAYLKAYNATGDDKYLSKFREVAERVNTMQGVVDAATEVHKAEEKAARDLAASQKKLAEVQEAAANAAAGNDLKAFYAANKKVTAAGGTAASPIDFSATTSNIDAFIGNLKEKVADADLGSDLYNALTSQLADATLLSNVIKMAVKNGIDVSNFDPQELWKKVFSDNPADYIDNSVWEEIRAKMEEILGRPIKINTDTGDLTEDGKNIDKSFRSAASAISSVGSALSQIEDPGAKILGIVGQAIATTAQAFASALAEDKTTKSNIWAFIGASAASMVAMAAAISQIHSATGYAHGGMIKGNSYSGDNMMAMGPDGWIGLNAGEIVLNAAQSANVAQGLQGAGGGKMEIVGVLSGENVVLMADRWGRRTGRGELLFGKNL